MDIIKEFQAVQSMEEELKIKVDERDYRALLELADQRIKITIMTELSQYKWSDCFSIEQFYKINGLFIACSKIESVFEYLRSILKSNEFKIRISDKKMILSFSEQQRNIKFNFDIQLKQEVINALDAIGNLNQAILDLRQQNLQLQLQLDSKVSSKQKEQQDLIALQQTKLDEVDNYIKAIQENNFPGKIQELQQRISQLEKENKEQENKINKQKQEYLEFVKQSNEKINEHHNLLQQIKQSGYQNQIQELKENFTLFQKAQHDNEQFSIILKNRDVDTIDQWIDKGHKKMNLQLLYRASEHGFGMDKFYEKCLNRSPTIVLIKTTQERRFGGYSDLKWVNTNQSVPSNPNKCFIFSLNLNKKFTPNSKNCESSIYGDYSCFAFGQGDILVCSNSNTNSKSYTCVDTYRNKEGITNTCLAGESNFTTSEIEVFQVDLV